MSNSNLANRRIQGDEPLIVFIGPRNCGKSMVLMSLVEHLRGKGYTVNANMNYIPGDSSYKQKCMKFTETLRNNAAITRDYKKGLDGSVDELLVDVRLGTNGDLKFRMLEAPGEHFFSLNNPDKDYARYLENIISNKRLGKFPVYFVMLLVDNDNTDSGTGVELNEGIRSAYESRLIEFFENGYDHSRGDKIVLLYNKIDLVPNKNQTLKNILRDDYAFLKNKLRRTVFVFFKVPVYNGVQPYKTGAWTSVEEHNGEVVWHYQIDKESKRYAEDLFNTLISKF